MSNKQKIRLLANVFPQDIKLLMVFEHGTYVSEIKEYIQDTLRGMNLGFHIGRITNNQGYILLNDNVRLNLLSIHQFRESKI